MRMIRDIDKRFLKGRFGKPKLKKVKMIAIDEISVRNGYKYLTMMTDSVEPVGERVERRAARSSSSAKGKTNRRSDASERRLQGSKITTMKRQAYGYRDADDFEFKRDALHEARFALIGENTPAHRDRR